ncbi:pentapeptide repeat-containing protein [Nonomuraea sp. NN258]|uniref:pentapeptide repeat-containing protein n=1 Tax=Nonomuraea antri TaxID=2730852 RepID=UPI001568BF08|nr:pentapeptide repeat-containing protein [Nonomuraea antri]NRQ36267.1 pentapeptide repeat-containing protein [Nonomuraea antri]
MADRKHGVPAPPTESTVRSEDWDGRVLQRESFHRVLFVDVDMTELVNEGSTFEECTFSSVRFNVSEHRDAQFLNCTFKRCSLFDAAFHGCKLTGSMFDGCTYGLLKVDGGDWSYVGLPGADLRNCTFDGVRLREADLTGARFESATLARCDLTGAWLREADLTKCDLRGSDLGDLDPYTAKLNKAIIDPVQATTLARAMGLEVRG